MQEGDFIAVPPLIRFTLTDKALISENTLAVTGPPDLPYFLAQFVLKLQVATRDV